jgi:nicotinic acid mononucleotide adenylyltransferase
MALIAGGHTPINSELRTVDAHQRDGLVRRYVERAALKRREMLHMGSYRLEERVDSYEGRAATLSSPAVIGDRVSRELYSMRSFLGSHADVYAFEALERLARSTLEKISDLVSHGEIRPLNFDPRRGAPGERWPLRPSRLGVFPIAANPLHWLHLLGGLAAMERFRLDRVLYIVAGSDPRKPEMAPETARHRIVKDVLRLFCPLLKYSPAARGGSLDGEEHVFRILSLAQGALAAPIHVFYIAGSDHFRPFSAARDRPDTVRKLEDGMRRGLYGFEPGRDRLSAVFLDRGGHLDAVETRLDVRWVHDLPLRVSSTGIRAALNGEAPLGELSYLPFTAYRVIRANGLYNMENPGVTHRRGPAGRGMRRGRRARSIRTVGTSVV